MVIEIIWSPFDNGGMLNVDWENIDFFMVIEIFFNKGFPKTSNVPSSSNDNWKISLITI
jgi:hypothetical protein